MNSLWDILSVAIGISFIFMILSILNSWIQDYIATLFDLRANNLADVMQNLLEPGVLKLNGKDRARENPPEINIKQTRPLFGHKVQQNDETLSKLAEKYGVAVADLRIANREVLDELPLKAGDTLKIPERSYTVQASGTMSKIMDQLGASIANLKLANSDASLQDGKPATIPNDPQTQTSTLKSIAGEFEVPIDDLQNANPDIPGELPLQEGTSLKIPEISHRVQGDDTLSKLAEAYKRSIDDLRNANLEVLDELPLPVGIRLKFPEPKADRYTVLEGDTIKSIALGFGISIEDLQKANKDLHGIDPLVRFDESQVGKTLEIPKPDIGQLVSRKDTFNHFILNPVATLYKHPAIHSLSKPFKLPDLIPTKDFTVALLDLLDDLGRLGGKKPSDTISIDFIIKGIERLEDMGVESNAGRKDPPPLAFRLRSLLYAAQINTQINTQVKAAEATLQEFHKAVSEWFDDTVARGSGWYKRRMQQIGIISGFILAVVLNADTLGLSNALWHNAMLRETIIQTAQASADQGQPTGEQARLQLEQMTNLGLPLGWSFDVEPGNARAFPSTAGGWITKIAGLLVTGLAISQGSQLWFDLMNRLLNLRSSRSQPDSDEQPAKNRR